MYTSKNIHQDVQEIVDGLSGPDTFNTQAIADELYETYGLTPVKDIPSHRFWVIFEKHIESVVLV